MVSKVTNVPIDLAGVPSRACVRLGLKCDEARWCQHRPPLPVRQVVILAAGYDTRAYRLAAPGVSYFELDLPYASETKRRLVQATLPEWQAGVG